MAATNLDLIENRRSELQAAFLAFGSVSEQLSGHFESLRAQVRQIEGRHRRATTVLPFGVAAVNGDGVVRGFVEKPRSEHWINGGFFCLSPEVLDLMRPESVLEREPLARLAADGRLRAYRHEGFWGCMDTYKDAVMLNDLWANGGAPWKLWE